MCFKDFIALAATFDHVTEAKALALPADPPHGGQGTHCSLSDSGLDSDPFAQSSLLSIYVEISVLKDAHTLLEAMSERDVISWSALVSRVDVLPAVGGLEDLILGSQIQCSFCAHCMAAFKAHVYFVLQVRNLIAHFLWGKGSCGVVSIKLFWLSLLGVVKCLQSLPGHVLHKSLRWKVGNGRSISVFQHHCILGSLNPFVESSAPNLFNELKVSNLIDWQQFCWYQHHWILALSSIYISSSDVKDEVVWEHK
ncbi:hypothetical protein RHSIM_Rhsim02G0010200 [Rhododendron simsii]|uniref:Pentatricopeptide repeat-containing protein n=1 Tax=Rhododendron simsii TaxID=118357 RepID=A0A834HLC3_RHOSS|nr:hypothetical protein RHSIM_Rhsim02G0010200 [Rhododendron simsii]